MSKSPLDFHPGAACLDSGPAFSARLGPLYNDGGGTIPSYSPWGLRGSAEYVALQLKSWGVESAFFWYVAGMAALAFIGGIWMADTRKGNHLDGAARV